jgi:hypothetical protein
MMDPAPSTKALLAVMRTAQPAGATVAVSLT